MAKFTNTERESIIKFLVKYVDHYELKDQNFTEEDVINELNTYDDKALFNLLVEECDNITDLLGW